MQRQRKIGPALVGIFLIILGVIWVLNNTGTIDIELRAWWPLIIIAIGLAHLGRKRNLMDFGSWFFIGIGVLFLLTENNILDRDEVWKYWPVILILVGLSIVFGGFGYSRRHNQNLNQNLDDHHHSNSKSFSDENTINESALFSGVEKRINSDKFKGGTVSATFGGVELDLSSSQLAPEGAYLELTALFGGIEIRIPDSWSVEIRSTAILGGVEQRCANPVKHTGPRLVIKANATFGGVDIKN
jgi:predicted membrane protein